MAFREKKNKKRKEGTEKQRNGADLGEKGMGRSQKEQVEDGHIEYRFSTRPILLTEAQFSCQLSPYLPT